MKRFLLLLAAAFAQTPQCIVTPTGLAGSWTGTTAGSTLGFSGTCNGVSYSSSVGENMLIVNVPRTAPLGGTLTLDTCTGTRWDTEILVSAPLMPGVRCPTNFTCAAANDDACGTQSRISIPAMPGSSYAVLVTGFGTSSGPYTLTWSYNVSSTTTGNTRSNTPTSRPTLSNSFTPQPSFSSTSSWSSSITDSATSQSSFTSTASWSSSITASASFTPSSSPIGSPSSSTTMTGSTTSTPDPSFSSSFTMRSSESASPSMDESPSMSDTHTGTSSGSSTRSSSASGTGYPSRTPVAPLAESAKTDNINAIGYTSIGALLGVFATIAVVTVFYSSRQRDKQRRSVHLSPNIYFNNPPKIEAVTETQNASFRTSPRKTAFDPVPAA